jgi:hypothetical protein
LTALSLVVHTLEFTSKRQAPVEDESDHLAGSGTTLIVVPSSRKEILKPNLCQDDNYTRHEALMSFTEVLDVWQREIEM